MDFQAIKNALPFGKKGMPRKKMTTPFSKKTLVSEAPEYPRPAMVRDSFHHLNGYWDYAITETPSRPDEGWKKILVPFPLESLLSEAGEHLTPGDYLWYRRTFEAPARAEGERVILHFGAVDQRCVVFVNGREVCTNHFGYLGFSADITKALVPGENTLSLRVQDDSDAGAASHGKQAIKPYGMFYSTVTGIWQTVWMEVVPETYIKELAVEPDYDAGTVTFTVTANKKNTPFTVEIHCDGTVISAEGTDKLTAEIPVIHPWTPETPYLYNCKVRLGKDEVSSYFAMRTFTCETDEKGIPRLCLNHKPYFQNGLLDQAYWPDGLYTAPCDEAFIWEIETAKRLGFNMLRIHAKVEAERFYYHCDRLGMIVWQDMVNGAIYNAPLLTWIPTLLPRLKISDRLYPYFFRTNKDARAEWIQECLETIHQLKHHPCIATWVIFNEGWGQFDSKKICKLVKNVDDTRIIDHASGWFDQGVGDIKSVHNYFRELTVEPDEHGRAFVLSEFGGLTHFVKYHSMCTQTFGYKTSDSLESLNKDIKDLFQNKIAPLIPEGLSAAVYTQLTDIEEEVNGLITYDRRIVKIESSVWS